MIEDMAALGFLMRGEVIWAKESSSSSSTAWGSWLSAVNPTLRDTHEYILVFSKSTYSRESLGKKKGGESTVTRDEFLEFTKSVWRFGAESARKVGHPAPFPVELPYRCIQLYTFKGDVGARPVHGLRGRPHSRGQDGTPVCRIRDGRGYAALSEERIRKQVDIGAAATDDGRRPVVGSFSTSGRAIRGPTERDGRGRDARRP